MDSNFIQSVINAAKKRGENKVSLSINPRNGENLWIVESCIELPSNFTLEICDCTLKMADGVFCNMFCNSQCLKDDNQQQNIHIVGKGKAILDGGMPNGLCEKNSEKDGFGHIYLNTMILMRNVRDFSVSNLKIANQRWWAMTFFYCDNGYFSNIDFEAMNTVPNQDGIDLRIGCHDIVIENITGFTGDDTIALTALSGRIEELFDIPNKNRDIHDIVIRNINTEITGENHIVRLLNHDGNKLYNINIENIIDRTIENGGARAYAALKIGDVRYFTHRRAMPEETYGITVKGISSRARYAVLIGIPSLTNATFDDISCIDGTLFGICP